MRAPPWAAMIYHCALACAVVAAAQWAATQPGRPPHRIDAVRGAAGLRRGPLCGRDDGACESTVIYHCCPGWRTHSSRSLVRGRAVRFGMTGSTFFGLVIWRFAI